MAAVVAPVDRWWRDWKTTLDFMSREVQDKLVAYVRSGGMLVLGPEVPYLDENMRPCSILGEHLHEGEDRGPSGLGVLVYRETAMGVPEVSELLSAGNIAPAVRSDDPAIDTVGHRLGSRTLAYAANPSCGTKTMAFPLEDLLKDLWTGEVLPARAVEVPPYSVRVLEAGPHDKR